MSDNRSSVVNSVASQLHWRLGQGADHGRMARVAEAWDRSTGAGRDVAEYNRRAQAYVFNVFGWLAEAARG